MNSLNTILLEGNLVRDPEFSTTASGASLCKFDIACNRYYKAGDEYKEEVSYFNIVTWGRTAETCNEYLAKGRGVRVVGRLKQDRWVDNDGKTRSRVTVVGEHVEFRAKPKAQQDPAGDGPGPGKGNHQQDDFEDDIPFN